MAIVSCPDCSKKLKVADTSVGKKVKCSCGNVFVAATERAAPAKAAAPPDKVVVACTECGAKLKVATASLGKKMKCPKCASVFVARSDEEVAAAPPKKAPVADSPRPKAKAKAVSDDDMDDLFSFAEKDAANESDDDEVKPKAKPVKKADPDDDDEDAAPQWKSKKKADPDEDEDDEPMPKSKFGKKAGKPTGSDDDEDDDADQKPVYPRRTFLNILVFLLLIAFVAFFALVFIGDILPDLGLPKQKDRALKGQQIVVVPESDADKKKKEEAAAAENKKEAAKLEGTWIVDSAAMDGKPSDEVAKGERVTITGGVVNGLQFDDAKIVVDGSKEPKWIDFTADKRVTLFGIFKIDGDALQVNIGKPKLVGSGAGQTLESGPRPTQFDSKSAMLFVLKREGKGKDKAKEKEKEKDSDPEKTKEDDPGTKVDDAKEALAVVGFEGPVNLYDEPELKTKKVSLESGAELTVLFARNAVVQVKTAEGDEGWIRRCWACSPTEFERRKSAKQVPKNVICVGANKKNTFMYGGGLSIQNGVPVVKAGDAFWFDSTMKGKPFEFGSEKVIGDPAVIFLKLANGKMQSLAIWALPKSAEDKKDKDKEKTGTAKLEGAWVIESAIAGGKSDDRSKGEVMTFADGKVTGMGPTPVPYTVTLTKDPHWIDVTIPVGKDKTAILAGIFKLDEGKLYLSVPGPKNLTDRPKDFEGKDAFVAVLRRASKDDSKYSRGRSVSHLKQIALAIHNYHDTNKQLPPAASSGKSDATGKPLLSWRVAILPYIEELALYQEFDLDKPWDDPKNLKLIAKMPKLYMVPGVDAKEGMTHYRTLVGPGTILEPIKSKTGKLVGRNFARILDGTSNVFMVVEAKDPTIWTMPDDLRYDPKGPLPKFGVVPAGFNAAFADGSVRFIPAGVPEKVLRPYLTGDNGMPREPLEGKEDKGKDKDFDKEKAFDKYKEKSKIKEKDFEKEKDKEKDKEKGNEKSKDAGRDKERGSEKLTETNKQELEKLNGTWIVFYAEVDEKTVEELNGKKFIFANGKVTTPQGGGATITVDGSKDPKWLDLTMSDKLTIQAIYSINRVGEMDLCMSSAKEVRISQVNGRPSKFDSKHGSLYLLKREQKKDDKGKSMFRTDWRTSYKSFAANIFEGFERKMEKTTDEMPIQWEAVLLDFDAKTKRLRFNLSPLDIGNKKNVVWPGFQCDSGDVATWQKIAQGAKVSFTCQWNGSFQGPYVAVNPALLPGVTPGDFDTLFTKVKIR